ncbi:MAG: NuoI/complex I 23 kDa subunit family protein [Dehalococcoidia bacterium]
MYGIGVLKGMAVTIQRMVMPPATIQFPEVTRPMSPRARTNLLWFDERCTGCSTCAQACPDGCILVHTAPNPDGTLEKLRYEIDFRICMYCGLCVEACPYQAIQCGGTMEDAVYEFDTMYKDKHDLTRLAHEFLRRNGYEYPHGQRAPGDIIELIERESGQPPAPKPPAGPSGQVDGVDRYGLPVRREPVPHPAPVSKGERVVEANTRG